MKRLAGKVAMITGGSRGIGREIASCLAKEGADIIIVSRHISDDDTVITQIKEYGRRVLAIQADISGDSACEKVIQKSLDSFDRIDVLINNAGIYPAADLLEITRQEWDAVFAVNLTAPMFLTQWVAKHAMIPRKKGRVVNISSIDGTLPTPGIAHYAASKAGLESLTRSMALELAPYQITANTVSPGWVETENLMKSDRWKKIVGKIPLNRLGKKQEIANAVVFLSSDEAGYITGASLNVNGGLLMR
jgi:3-oxoacyl-[acyl-carrier protein] reductase